VSFHIVLSEDIHPAGRHLLEQQATATVAPATDDAALRCALANADGLILRSASRVTARMLDAAPRIRLIGRHGAGLENIDLREAAARGVRVAYTPHANTTAVAEHTVACLLALLRHLLALGRAARSGDWQARNCLLGTELSSRVAGIVGVGAIGRRVASILARGFGMRILYADPLRAPVAETDLGAERTALRQLLSAADVVCLHVPLTADTRQLLDAAALARLRPTSVLVNTSRGAVLDEAALVAACDTGQLTGAALDVFSEEPLPASSPLVACERILLTPHSAAMTVTARGGCRPSPRTCSPCSTSCRRAIPPPSQARRTIAATDRHRGSRHEFTAANWQGRRACGSGDAADLATMKEILRMRGVIACSEMTAPLRSRLRRSRTTSPAPCRHCWPISRAPVLIAGGPIVRGER
jgi:phosphoglycerate dehydrogenase-like enzyme